MEECVWKVNYMFGKPEGYVVGCIQNPHHNRAYVLPYLCHYCGKKVVVKDDEKSGKE